MSAASNYELNEAVMIGAPFIPGEEATLLASARAGDPAAFECLVTPHWDGLLCAAQRILRNREDAEDAVQTALLDAFRNLNSFHGHSRFSSWLTRIAVNAALMRLRVSRRKRETSLDDVSVNETGEARAKFYPVEPGPNPEQEYLSNEGRALLATGIKKLRPLYAQVLHLRALQEFSSKETAKILELPVGTVKARLHRARTKLAHHVQSISTRKRSRASVRH